MTWEKQYQISFSFVPALAKYLNKLIIFILFVFWLRLRLVNPEFSVTCLLQAFLDISRGFEVGSLHPPPRALNWHVTRLHSRDIQNMSSENLNFYVSYTQYANSPNVFSVHSYWRGTVGPMAVVILMWRSTASFQPLDSGIGSDCSLEHQHSMKSVQGYKGCKFLKTSYHIHNSIQTVK
jgi:hypothetical protein